MRGSIACLALVLSAVLAACTGDGAQPTEPGQSLALPACRPDGILSVGERIPDCSFRTFDGDVLELTSLEGKPVVLNFWATWCPPCIKEMPDFEAVWNDLGDEVIFVGMNLLGVDGEVEGQARRFARERGVTYLLAFDPGGLLYSHFAVTTAMPATVFLDDTGTLTYRQFGPLNERQLRDLISEHLAVEAAA